MPFGLVNAPATFQRLMEVVLGGLVGKKCLVYIDDIVILGRTWEEHRKNLAEVLERLRAAGLRLKPRKCSFAQLEVSYLGHIVTEAGVRTDPGTVAAVREFPTPLNVKALRSFLGLASYYRRFIPNFARVAGPLHSLTKKDAPFVWTPQCELAFTELKRLMTSSPVLVYPDFHKTFILETDAAISGLGAVLAQDGMVRPIAYASRSLQPHEKNYGITEMEGLGAVWAVKHFRPYLYGHPCDLYTDHQALKSLLNTPQPSGKLARWGMAIQELDIRIHHRAGKQNSNADALSRAPLQLSPDAEEESRGVVAAVEQDLPEVGLGVLQREDEALSEIITFLERGVLPEDEKRAKVIVLSQSQYTMELYRVESQSDTPGDTEGGVVPHCPRWDVWGSPERCQGIQRVATTFLVARNACRRHSLEQRVSDLCHVQHRESCVPATHSNTPVSGPFDRVGVDVIQFPRSASDNQYAVVFVDYLTKWPEIFPVPAATIATLLVEVIVSRHGVPSVILSNRGKSFLSGLMTEVEELLGSHRVNTTAYHPQTDGLVERFNRTLTTMLAKTVRLGPAFALRAFCL